MLDVSASVKRGAFMLRAEVHDSGFICITGTNGSGKSTLLNLIAGNIAPDEGHVRVDSTDITSLPQELRRVVLVNPDSLIPHLDVEKHLRWGASARKVPLADATVEDAKSLLGITYTGRVDKLSLGMRERVSLATALLSGPRVILVDEAFSNIDERESFIARFKELCGRSKVDLLHTTQQRSDAAISDHHYDMVGGTTTKVF